jgi:hypothetical protein
MELSPPSWLEIPAKAGIQRLVKGGNEWIPAFAGISNSSLSDGSDEFE